jgi:hypothetical protein
LGQASSGGREKVIRALLQSAESHDVLKHGRCFVLESKLSYWRGVTNVFAELKAAEAVDLLIKTIHCGNGMTGSFSEEPSLDALIKMGPIAAPQLTKALKREHNEYIRVQISRCVSSIRYRQENSMAR